MKVIEQRTQPRRSYPGNFLLNVLTVGLSALVIYLLYALISHLLHPPIIIVKPPTGRVIQIDVLNGCGAAGVAVKFRDYLRDRHYDVVEMGNYKSFDVDHSIVIDRTGDLETAKEVAYALGISEKNVVQQITPDYYLDVSVVIGRDYNELNPMK